MDQRSVSELRLQTKNSNFELVTRFGTMGMIPAEVEFGINKRIPDVLRMINDARLDALTNR